MADRLSQGPLFVTNNGVAELNDVLRRIQNELDERKGLRGRAIIHDRVEVQEATDDEDAVRLEETVTTTSDQEISGEKTFSAPIRYLDSEGILIHAFGTKD